MILADLCSCFLKAHLKIQTCSMHGFCKCLEMMSPRTVHGCKTSTLECNTDTSVIASNHLSTRKLHSLLATDKMGCSGGRKQLLLFVKYILSAKLLHPISKFRWVYSTLVVIPWRCRIAVHISNVYTFGWELIQKVT